MNSENPIWDAHKGFWDARAGSTSIIIITIFIPLNHLFFKTSLTDTIMEDYIIHYDNRILMPLRDHKTSFLWLREWTGTDCQVIILFIWFLRSVEWFTIHTFASAIPQYSSSLDRIIGLTTKHLPSGEAKIIYPPNIKIFLFEWSVKFPSLKSSWRRVAGQFFNTYLELFHHNRNFSSSSLRRITLI